MRLALLVSGVLAASAMASVAFAGSPISSVTVNVSPAVQAKAAKRDSRYGQRDLDYLQADLQRSIERANPITPNGDRLEVTITDLKPNRPTFKEMGNKLGLSPLSPAIGGASLEGVRISPDGTRTPMKFQRYDIDITQSVLYGLTPWSTAQNAFTGFARKVATN